MYIFFDFLEGQAKIAPNHQRICFGTCYYSCHIENFAKQTYWAGAEYHYTIPLTPQKFMHDFTILFRAKHSGTFILVLYLCECVCVCVVIYLRVCHLFLSCHGKYLQMCKNSGLFYSTKTLPWLHSRGQHNGIVDVYTVCRQKKRVERCLRIW